MERLIEALIVIVAVIVVGLLIVATVKSREDFGVACARQGGEVVYDGRQWQCLGKSAEQH